MQYYITSGNTALAHHGILGQKWGVRRYQNSDGTLTDAGKKRYNKLNDKLNKSQEKAESRREKAQDRAESYNRSSHKIFTVPGAKSINRFKYDVSDFMYDRAVNKTNKIYKKISKLNVNELSASQIKKGEQFLHNPRTSAMLEASMRSQNADMKSDMRRMQKDINSMRRSMYY